MKQYYQNPVCDLQMFPAEDLLTTSGEGLSAVPGLGDGDLDSLDFGKRNF